MKSLTMTESQSKTFDQGGEHAIRLMRCLKAEAAWLLEGNPGHVEIYHSEGFVVDCVDTVQSDYLEPQKG